LFNPKKKKKNKKKGTDLFSVLPPWPPLTSLFYPNTNNSLYLINEAPCPGH
jgi:hypothetical protein